MEVIFYAEAKTKDDRIGTIVMDEKVEVIVAECGKWLEEEGISPQDVVSPCPVMNRESGMELGKIYFTDTAVDYRSNY